MTLHEKKTEAEESDVIDVRPPAESFKFENPGDRVAGAVLDLEMGETEYGRAPILVLDTEDGERSVWMFGKLLQGWLARRKPERGSQVAITYLGKTKSKDGPNEYNDYRIECDRDLSRPIDYGQLHGATPDLSVVPSDDGEPPLKTN